MSTNEALEILQFPDDLLMLILIQAYRNRPRDCGSLRATCRRLEILSNDPVVYAHFFRGGQAKCPRQGWNKGPYCSCPMKVKYPICEEWKKGTRN